MNNFNNTFSSATVTYSPLFFCFLLAAIITSCGSNSSDEKVEDKDTLYHVQCKDSINNKRGFDLFCKKYYPTGELAATYTTLGDSILYGTYKNFYKSGQLKDSCNYISNFKYGTYQSFYENGKEKANCDYVILNYREDYLNQFIEYDSITGESIKGTKYSYWFELGSHEVIEGDSIEVDFSFDNPMYGDSVYLEIGSFDEMFMISEENKLQTKLIPVTNKEATFKFFVVKKEFNALTGIIHDLSKDGKERLFYFQEVYTLVE